MRPHLSLRLAVLLLLSLLALPPLEAYAAHPRVQSVTFRLHVAGPVESDATFWVAYGPLAGTFGILQLKRGSGGTYSASRSLPADQRTTYSYLQGHGAITSRTGKVPGNPVTTIWTLNSVTAARFTSAPYIWRAPVG